MKRLKYRLMTKVICGVGEAAREETVFTNCSIETPDADCDAALALARAEAYNGEVEVEDAGPDPDPTTEDRVAALEFENKTLKAQVSAQSEQMDFYEECIVEMASVVYA